MSDQLLYFPYINLPKTDWTVRTLLYYEKIGAIVPMDFFYEPEKNYDPFMLDLVKQQLVFPINPIEQLEHSKQLTTPFLAFINSDEYRLNEKRESFQSEIELSSRYQNYRLQPAKVYGQKFDEELMYSLSQLGLARHKKENWYSVENTTANYLMSFLASVLGGKLNMLPTTDDFFSGRFIRQFRKVSQEANTKRDEILEELIPMPYKINLTRLLKFKEKNIDNLKRFRNIVEQIALNPLYDNEALFSEKVKELKHEKESLTAKMNESKFGSFFFGTACGVFGAVQGLAQESTVGAVLGSLPGFASAIYSALKIEKAENTFDQTGMKYLALVDEQLKSMY